MNNQLHILIIDDDRFQQEALKKMADSTGLVASITLFANGKEAADYLVDTAAQGDSLPHVIFLDIHMPVMDAWKFLEAFSRFKRRLYRPIPVYVVTSSTDSFDMAKSRHHDTVKGYIIKPAAKEKVREILMSIESE